MKKKNLLNNPKSSSPGSVVISRSATISDLGEVT